MNRDLAKTLQRGRLIRVFADILMVNLCLMLALGIRYTIVVGIEGTPLSASGIFSRYLDSYLRTSGVLTLVSVFVFAFNGFYTYGRAYKGRYKLLIIVQAVSLSYLIFGALSYFSNGFLYLPRGAFLMAWVITLVTLSSSRLWAQFWHHLTHTESDKDPKRSTDLKHILVIGGAGYIGSSLTEHLLNKGYKVRLLDLLLYDTEPIKNMLAHPNLEVLQADFRQVDKVLQAMQGIDAVVHLGAIVGDPACAFDEKLTVEVNLIATRVLAEIAKGCGVRRFVFASTCSVYGASDEILDEHSRLNPVSLYARSKIASERVLLELADDTFSPTFLRFGTIYGFSGRIRFDLVVNLLTAKAKLEDQITVFGGDQWRPFVHVQDAALSVLKVLEAPEALVRNEVFNVGSNKQNYTINQIADLIKEALPNAEIIHMGTDGDRRNYRVNFDKIERVLGFTPRWTVEKGIEQVMKALDNGEVTDYRDARYSNLKFLKEEGSSRLVRSFNENTENLLEDDHNEAPPTDKELHV